MPRIYVGPSDRVSIQHPVTGKWIKAVKDEPTTELDDLDPKEYDLGPEWVTAPAAPPKPAPTPAPTPKDGDA